MELKDTVALMNSDDYKERFRAEYQQLKIRSNKLSNMIAKYHTGKLGFKPTCNIELLQRQLTSMLEYLSCLEARALIEGITL